MKDLHVLKKLLLLCSILATSSLYAEIELEDYLSREKRMIFSLQDYKNQLEAKKLRDSWISPVMLSYQKNWTEQPLSGTQSSTAFSIGIDQPIFKSGGIQYGIQYANALRSANSHDIAIQRRQLIGNAINILYQMKKTKLQRRKLALMIRNDRIDIATKQESYEAGLLDSSYLDQAILKKNQDASQRLDLELSLAKLRNSFRLLSRKNPDTLRVPQLKLISLRRYKADNLDLAVKRLRALEKEYSTKMTWSKYLPTVSVSASYTNTNKAATGMKDDYSTYGFKISMPLNINTSVDIESSRVSEMIAQTELQDSKRTANLEHQLVRKTIYILDKKMALARNDERLYRRLYHRTEDLVKAGEKTENDADTMRNSLRIKQLDRQIYAVDKQLKLLELYIKIQ